MSVVSLCNRGATELSEASERKYGLREGALRRAVVLDLGGNKLTTLQRPIEVGGAMKSQVSVKRRASASPMTDSTSLVVVSSYNQQHLTKNMNASRELSLGHSQSLSYNGLQSCSALAPMQWLEHLSLRNNKLTSLTGLAATARTLTTLVAPHNELTDLTGLETCLQLKYIDLRYNRLRSLRGLPREFPLWLKPSSGRPTATAAAARADVSTEPKAAPATTRSHSTLEISLPSSSTSSDIDFRDLLSASTKVRVRGSEDVNALQSRKDGKSSSNPTRRVSRVERDAYDDEEDEEEEDDADGKFPFRQRGTPKLSKNGIVLLLGHNELRGKVLMSLFALTREEISECPPALATSPSLGVTEAGEESAIQNNESRLTSNAVKRAALPKRPWAQALAVLDISFNFIEDVHHVAQLLRGIVDNAEERGSGRDRSSTPCVYVSSNAFVVNGSLSSYLRCLQCDAPCKSVQQATMHVHVEPFCKGDPFFTEERSGCGGGGATRSRQGSYGPNKAEDIHRLVAHALLHMCGRCCHSSSSDPSQKDQQQQSLERKHHPVRLRLAMTGGEEAVEEAYCARERQSTQRSPRTSASNVSALFGDNDAGFTRAPPQWSPPSKLSPSRARQEQHLSVLARESGNTSSNRGGDCTYDNSHMNLSTHSVDRGHIAGPLASTPLAKSSAVHDTKITTGSRNLNESPETVSSSMHAPCAKATKSKGGDTKEDEDVSTGYVVYRHRVPLFDSSADASLNSAATDDVRAAQRLFTSSGSVSRRAQGPKLAMEPQFHSSLSSAPVQDASQFAKQQAMPEGKGLHTAGKRYSNQVASAPSSPPVLLPRPLGREAEKKEWAMQVEALRVENATLRRHNEILEEQLCVLHEGGADGIRKPFSASATASPASSTVELVALRAQLGAAIAGKVTAKQEADRLREQVAFLERELARTRAAITTSSSSYVVPLDGPGVHSPAHEYQSSLQHQQQRSHPWR